MKNKKVFGFFELIFDVFYLLAGLAMAIILLSRGINPPRTLAGVMALVLIIGDGFHLIPRIGSILAKDTGPYQKALGLGKLVTSLTMTVFYIFLWHIGLTLFKPPATAFYTSLLYLLALARIVLCLFPQNQWLGARPSVKWGIIRNIPFVLEGLMVLGLFFVYRESFLPFRWLWLAILLSFAFYLPVVLWAHRKPAVGMLMLPKTCMYLWMLWLCLFL